MGASTKVENSLPNVVWLEHILPCLDRPSWNALMEASKVLYTLATASRLTAEYNNLGPAIAQPPWPTNLSFQSKFGGQGQAIESLTISQDGEFMACGSVIGGIEIWNLRTGKLKWKKSDLLNNDEAEIRAQCPNYYATNDSRRGQRGEGSSSIERRSTPIGSVLRFSPEGHKLACGFENRIFVWDLRQELRKRQRVHRLRNGNHPTVIRSQESQVSALTHFYQRRELSGRKPNGKVSNYAFPPQPQLRDDPSEDSDRDSYQILEIECRQGTIYEVTYIGFSNTDDNFPAGHRMIARYGKMAYIWSKSTANTSDNSTLPFTYIMTHRIALTSSRCQMVSNASLTRVAVATNGGSASASSRRQRNADRGEIEQSNESSTARKVVDGKGIIHVWDLSNAYSENNESQPGSTPVVTNESSTRVVAYPKHVVRGLEFLNVEQNSSDDCCLVSASLQGEVKFWKKHVPAPKHPRDRYNNPHHDVAEETNDDEIAGIDHNERETSYVCVYRFQSPGKIFSLASWSSLSSGGNILLAAGEARGQVRVWKISSLSLYSSDSSEAALELSENSSQCHKGSQNFGGDKQQRLEECLSTEVGDHVHYDNIKLLEFTPNGKSLAVSRAYDSKIWFQTVW